MKIDTLLYPKDMPREEAEAVVDRVMAAAKAVAAYLEPQGFFYNWAMLADNTRVYIGLDGDEVVAFGHMTYGRRFHDTNQTASVTILESKTQLQREFMLDHIKEQAKVLGCSALLFEGKPEDRIESEAMPLRSIKLR